MSAKEVPFDPQWPKVNGAQGPVHTNNISLDAVVDAVEALPERHRETLERLFWERLTLRQYAEELGITKQAVSKRKKKALEALREVLDGTVGN